MEDRFGVVSIAYNVHYPMNPEAVKAQGCDIVAALKEVNHSSEY